MAGNRHIADAAVAYVLKETWSQSGAWGHIEGEIYKGILWAALSYIFSLRCMDAQVFWLKRISTTLIIRSVYKDAT